MTPEDAGRAAFLKLVPYLEDAEMDEDDVRDIVVAAIKAALASPEEMKEEEER